jgi:hypothetical protein
MEISPFSLRGAAESPIKHLILDGTNNNRNETILSRVVDRAINQGLGLVKAAKIDKDKSYNESSIRKSLKFFSEAVFFTLGSTV